MSEPNAPYSALYSAILDVTARKRVGRQLKRLIEIHFGGKTSAFKALDVGAGGGIITHTVAPLFKTIVGIDPDPHAIDFAQNKNKGNNIRFMLADALQLPFPARSFDFVLCNQVYEFVRDDEQLLREIYRVLKPGGWCLLGAANKLTLVEQQYRLPLLHWLPRPFAAALVRRSGRGIGYSGRYRTYFGLKKLVSRFRIVDYSPRIIREPARFGFRRLTPLAPFARLIPLVGWKILLPFIPNYLWMLQKKP